MTTANPFKAEYMSQLAAKAKIQTDYGIAKTKPVGTTDQKKAVITEKAKLQTDYGIAKKSSEVAQTLSKIHDKTTKPDPTKPITAEDKTAAEAAMQTVKEQYMALLKKLDAELAVELVKVENAGKEEDYFKGLIGCGPTPCQEILQNIRKDEDVKKSTDPIIKGLVMKLDQMKVPQTGGARRRRPAKKQNDLIFW